MAKRIDPERLRALNEQGERARREMDEIIARVEARRTARGELLARRRARLRRLTFGLLGRS